MAAPNSFTLPVASASEYAAKKAAMATSATTAIPATSARGRIRVMGRAASRRKRDCHPGICSPANKSSTDSRRRTTTRPLARAGPRFVFRAHAHAIGPGGEDREQVALARREPTVLGEEVGALAYRPDDVVNSARAAGLRGGGGR